jgi:hypothetical protein
MIEIPLGKLQFNDDVAFAFPNSLCCNCGTKAGLTVIEQDTRRTTYMIGGGTEITFKLPLPFCEDCAPTAARKPKNIVHRILGFIVAFGLAALAQIVLGDLVFDDPAMARYIVPVALLFAACASLAWFAIGRPRGGQTSHFQPVRIPTLKREFVSGVVTAIGFSFTNKQYARAFYQANKAAVEQGVVSIAQA